MKSILKLSLITVMTFVSFCATSAYIVFDPTNYTANNLAAIKSVTIELQSIQQTITQAQQLQTMYTHLQNINPTLYGQQAQAVQQNLTNLQQYQSATQNVSTSLGTQGDYITKLQTMYATSGSGTFSGFISSLAKKAANGDLAARNMFDTATATNNSVATAAAQRQALQVQVSSNAGLMQSTQTTNQYLDLLAGQGASLQQMMSQQVSAAAEEKAKQSVIDQQKVIDMNAANTQQKNDANSFNSRWKTGPFKF